MKKLLTYCLCLIILSSLIFVKKNLAVSQIDLAVPQTVKENEDNFDSLIAAFVQARRKYNQVFLDFWDGILDTPMNEIERILYWTLLQNQETLYWLQQIKFYRDRIMNNLNKYYQAAHQNPYAFCKEALRRYDLYIRARNATLSLEERLYGMDPVDIYFPPSLRNLLGSTAQVSNARDRLSIYCRRYN